MTIKFVVVGVILLFILSFSGCVKETPTTEGKTIYVDDDGDKDFTNIQDAIEAADSGNTIYVHDGTYYERILVDKAINLIGKNKDTVIIDGGGNGTVVSVSTDRVNISGFTIQNGGKLTFDGTLDITAGICVNSNCNTISGNAIANNEGAGILCHYSSGNTIANNTVIDNNMGGISLMDLCGNNTISNNTIMNRNHPGITLTCSKNNTISDNTIINNTPFPGILLCPNSSYNKIVRNVIANNPMGITIDGSENNYVSDNIITGGDTGIDLGHSSYNVITRNDITDNRYYGIDFGSADGPATHNIISENNIVKNGETGIYIDFLSNNNTIYHNNFVDNNQSAYDSCVNTWDNGSVGNYWSDYSWFDENNDGIGDVPYDIPGGNNQDRYPVEKIKS